MTAKTMAEVLAEHSKVSMGMTSGSPDTCKCGERIYPGQGDTDITERRDASFAAHQSDALSAAGFGLVADAKAEALEEAADAAADPSPEDMDTYFLDQADVGRWLHARAAALRGDS